MNIFELSEEKIKEVLQNELNKVTPEELLEELINCGLKEEISITDEAKYNVMATMCNNQCNLWVHKETSGGKRDLFAHKKSFLRELLRSGIIPIAIMK